MPNIGIPNTFGPDVQAQMSWLDANFAAGLVTFASIATSVQGGSSTNSLRSNTLASLNQVYVEGYYANVDGGEGVFVLNPTDQTTNDNGGTIIVDAVGQRWYRSVEGLPYFVKWFGAKGNGTTDDTGAIQNCLSAALAASPSIPVVWFNDGYYLVNSGPIIIGSSGSQSGASLNLSLRGPAGNLASNGATTASVGGAVLVTASATQGVLATPSPANGGNENNWNSNVVIEDITVFGPGFVANSWSSAAQAAVGVDLGYLFNCRIKNLHVEGFGKGLRLRNVAETYQTGTLLLQNNYKGLAGEIDQTGGNGDWAVSFDNLIINNNTFADMALTGCRSCIIKGGECISDNQGTYTPASPRIQIDASSGYPITFIMSNFSAENHAFWNGTNPSYLNNNGLPLISLANQSNINNIDISSNLFQSFNFTVGSSTYQNTLIASFGSNYAAAGSVVFDYLKMTDNAFDHITPQGNLSMFTPPIYLLAEDIANFNYYSMRTDIRGNSPVWFDTLNVVIREADDFTRTALPSNWINVVFADNRMWPTVPHSRFNNPATTATIVTSASSFWGPSLVALSSGSAPTNFISIYPYAPLKSYVWSAVLWVNDAANTLHDTVPEFHSSNLGAGPNLGWSYIQSDLAVVGGKTITKYVFTFSCAATNSLSNSGLTELIFNNFINSNTDGLYALALYAPSEFCSGPNQFTLPPATSIPTGTAPGSGNYGIGEVVMNRQPGSNSAFLWCCTSGGGSGTYVFSTLSF